MRNAVEEDAEAVRRKLLNQRAPTTLNPDLLDQARTMGRQGVLQSMVLFDINKQEALDLAKRNLLEYRSDGKLKTSNETEIKGNDVIRKVGDYSEVK